MNFGTDDSCTQQVSQVKVFKVFWILSDLLAVQGFCISGYIINYTSSGLKALGFLSLNKRKQDRVCLISQTDFYF